jgi:hypothetical protein
MRSRREIEVPRFRDGVPCEHPGCLSHISHPCEGCGRIGGVWFPRWYEEKLKRFADAEPGGLMACSPELLTELIELAKTDEAVKATLVHAGINLGEGNSNARIQQWKSDNQGI